MFLFVYFEVKVIFVYDLLLVYYEFMGGGVILHPSETKMRKIRPEAGPA